METYTKEIQNINSDKNINPVYLILFAIGTAALWQFEIGRYILYPFTILGTYFHEISHGIAAMILGAKFHKLEIFANGSGVATYSGELFLGRFGTAFVAAAGPLGPAVFGSIFLISSNSRKMSKVLLIALSVFMVLSVILWIRTLFGAIIISIFGIGIFFAAIKLKEKTQKILLQFLGVQAIVSLFLSVDYLFSKGASTGAGNYYSDTAVMQNELLLPYWFWGGSIILVSLLLLYFSLKFVFSKKSKNVV